MVLARTNLVGTNATTASVQSVDRAVTLLQILARDGDVGVTDLAHELRVHKSTASRLVSALERRGLVEQDGQRGKYRLGHGILTLANATVARLDVVQASRTVTSALAHEVGETINVATLSGNQALYLDQTEASNALRSYNWVGQRVPLHATSNGKVLLAWRSPEERRTLLDQPLARYTRRTITSPRRLAQELDEVRVRGYAKAVDELEIGLVAVAAPIRGADGSVIASMSVSGPDARLHGERLTTLGRRIRRAADEASVRMGWQRREGESA
jgi:IclR family transcriptional regulator, KDG regulon repressor